MYPSYLFKQGGEEGGAYLILWPQGWALFWGGWGVHGRFFEKLRYVQMSRHSAIANQNLIILKRCFQ